MKTKNLVIAAMVGALYVTLTMAGAQWAFGPIQCRFSEALTVLPFFFPGTAWGLFVGCLLANILGGVGLIDIVFGSLATLAAALLTSKIKNKFLAPLPAVLINAVVVGATIAYATSPEAFLPAFGLIGAQVGLGELIACYALGLPILFYLPKIGYFKNLIKQ